MKRRPIHRGELLALDPRAVRSDRKAIWWDFFTQVPENEHVETSAGGVCVVHIRGSLEHHAGIFGDSYDAIRDRVTDAMDHEDSVAVVLRIDSPGGVVSGLNETVRWMREQAQKRGKPLLGYVDELAASAAFALSCACSEVYAPRDAIIGSVGCIATMFDQVALDQKLGLNFVTLTSGDRKSDGHPHVAISDQALAVEQSRIDKLALGFYKLVAAARPIPLADLKSTRGFQAGIFLAPKAEKMGLIDGVMSWEAFLDAIPESLANMGLDKPSASASTSLRDESRPQVKGNETDRRAAPRRSSMNIQLTATLKRLKAQMSAETDPEKKASLATQISHVSAAIEAGKTITHEKHEKKKVTQDDSDDGDEGDEDEGDEEDEEEESAEHDEPDGDEGDGDSDDDGDGDDDSDEEEDEAEEEESAEYEEEDESAESEDDDEARKASASAASGIGDLATRRAVKRAVRSAVLQTRKKMRAAFTPIVRAARRATGQKNARAIVGALQAMPKKLQSAARVERKVERLETSNRRARVDGMLKEAARAGRITPAMKASLRDQGMKDPQWLKGHLATLPRVVRRKGEEFVPREGADGSIAPATADQKAMMASATAGMSADERAIYDQKVADINSKRASSRSRI